MYSVPDLCGRRYSQLQLYRRIVLCTVHTQVYTCIYLIYIPVYTIYIPIRILHLCARLPISSRFTYLDRLTCFTTLFFTSNAYRVIISFFLSPAAIVLITTALMSTTYTLHNVLNNRL